MTQYRFLISLKKHITLISHAYLGPKHWSIPSSVDHFLVFFCLHQSHFHVNIFLSDKSDIHEFLLEICESRPIPGAQLCARPYMDTSHLCNLSDLQVGKAASEDTFLVHFVSEGDFTVCS